ncbi:MAG: TPM domain-containing protein [Acidobacteriota bacterium]|nr:TPM domain-containing protein [Acidobacteriota bacterium]
MKRGIQGAILLLALLAVCFAARAETLSQLRPKGYVSDFARIIDPATQQKLTALCQEVNQKAKAQIAVVTVRTTSGIPLEEFSINLAERWGVGPKTNDRGAMILLVVNDHRYRIEVGYGLEGVLPDGKVGRIGREAVPLLREQNYSGALMLMTKRVADAIAAGRGITLTSVPPIPESDSSEPTGGFPLGTVLFLIFFFGLPTLGWLLPLLLSGALTNPRGRGYAGRRPWIAGGYWPGTWTGGGFGGGGSGWGGGGGFGGFGGGSFGGGGASGSW